MIFPYKMLPPLHFNFSLYFSALQYSEATGNTDRLVLLAQSQ